MRKLIPILLTIVLASCSGQVPMSVQMTQSQMTRSGGDPSYLDYRDGQAKWNYTPGLELRAYFDVYEKYGDRAVFDFAEKWYDCLVESDGTIVGYKMENYSTDHICPGKSLMYLYEKTGKEKYRRAADTLALQVKNHPRTSEGALWHKKIYPDQVWLDGVYMFAPFYVEYASRYLEGEAREKAYAEIVNEFVLAYDRTYDPATGLCRHAWDESRSQAWADPNTGQSAHCWARGLGWYCMACLDVLDWLPKGYEGREAVLTRFETLCNELPKWADPETGMWYQVLDCPGREGNYLEATASAMFTFAFLKGVRLGYLSADLEDYAEGLYKSLVRTFITEDTDGLISLQQCCAVGGLGGKNNRMGDYAYYLSEPVRPNDSKGVAPFVWACLEMEL